MSWVTLALGLIRDVATTEQGQEIINDLRGGSSGDKAANPAPAREEELGQWRQSVEDRMSVTDRNTRMLVGMLNAQHETLISIQKRQRILNVVLGAGVLIAIGVPIVWWLFLRQ